MTLSNKKIIILVEEKYQELEFWYPYLRMQEAGASMVIVSGEKDKTYKSEHGYPVTSEKAAEAVNPQDYDGVIVPGGYAPDRMRVNQPILDLVKSLHEKGKLVAAVCHAPWVLVSANILSGKKVTCYHTIKDDVQNAGGQYLDKEVVIDGNIITSRQPGDLPAFCREIIKKLQG